MTNLVLLVKVLKVSVQVENILGKKENSYQHFLLFSQGFYAKLHIAHLVAYRTLEQEVAGLIPGSATVLSKD